MQKRRTFLKSTGAFAAAAGISGVSAAAGPDGAKGAGINESVTKLLQKGKIQQATRLLENHGVEHALKRSPSGQPSTTDTTTSEDVSTQNVPGAFQKDESLLALLVYNLSGNEYRAWSSFNIGQSSSNSSNLDASGPVDPIAITFSDTYWQPVSQSESNFSGGYTEHGVFSESGHGPNYEDYQLNGVLGSYDDPTPINTDEWFEGWFQTDLEKLGSDGSLYNVNAEYVHSWWVVPGTWSFSLGPFGVEVGGTADSWRLETTEKA